MSFKSRAKSGDELIERARKVFTGEWKHPENFRAPRLASSFATILRRNDAVGKRAHRLACLGIAQLMLGEFLEQFCAYRRESVVSAADRQCGGHPTVLDAEETREFRFEVKKRSLGGRVAVQISKCALKQVVKLRRGVSRFGNEFEEFNEICGDCHAYELRAETLVCFVHQDFTQDV